MVQVTFQKSDFGTYGCKIENHAGDSLICSAVSALGMALVGTLQRFSGMQFVNCYYGDGLVNVEIMPLIDDDNQSLVDMVFETVYVGLKQIETTYPDNIRVYEKRY